MSDSDFFKDFPPVSREEWEQRILRDLKGKPLETLYWEVAPGVEVKPAYHPSEFEGGIAQDLKKEQNSWYVGEVIDIEALGLEAANKTGRRAIDFGAQALIFNGADKLAPKDLPALLKGIDQEAVQLCFSDFGTLEHAIDLGMQVANNYEGNKASGAFNYPLFAGETIPTKEKLADYFTRLSGDLPAYKLFSIDVTAMSKEVESVPREIAEVTHRLCGFIDYLMDAELPVEDYLSKLYFRLAVGTSYFVEIAKVRALRWLVAEVLKAYKLNENLYFEVEAHLSAASFKEDQYQNMIQSTTQAISAVIGGVDRLIVLPSNANTALPTSFTRRIARNVQHLLKLESHLDLVKDPAAGSYYVEHLTEKLGKAAWELFQQSRSNNSL